MGIPVHSNKETIEFLGGENYNRKVLQPQQIYQIGSFKVMPFDLKHDVPCFGYLINHEECGNIVFITDSYYSPYCFEDVNFWIIEANYSKEIIDKKYIEGKINPFLRNRILLSHLSIENCLELLKVNDLRQTRKIVLIHLSDSNSNEKMFKFEVEKETKKEVVIADSGIEVDFNLFGF